MAETLPTRSGDAQVSRTYREAFRLVSANTQLRFRFRFVHQPNALASFAVLCVPAILYALARRSNSSVVCSGIWVLVDYDSADDQQLLRLQMPTLLRDLQTRTSSLVSRRLARRRLASSLPSSAVIPRMSVLRTGLLQSVLALRHHLLSRGIMTKSRRESRRQIENSIACLDAELTANQRLTDALGQHSKWTVKDVFGIDLEIVTGTDWLLSQAPLRLRVLRWIAAQYPALISSGAWRVCPYCYTRTRVPITSYASGDLISPATRCIEGHLLSAVPFDLTMTVESAAGMCPMFVLPVRLDDIMERLIPDDSDLLVSYPGSFSHLEESVGMVRELRSLPGIMKRQSTPDWCPSHSSQNPFSALVQGSLLSDRERLSIACSLYRSSLAVAHSILPIDLGAEIGKHVGSILEREAYE